jgi:putative protease
VIWPADEAAWYESVTKARRAGAVNFVLNAPWQISLFEGFLAQAARPVERGERPPRPLTLWAGPFCNIANPLAIAALARLGFSGAVVSRRCPGRTSSPCPPRAPCPWAS